MKRWIQWVSVLLLSFRAIAFGQEPLVVGYLPAIGHAKYFIAQEQGFFKDEKLQVELVEFQNSADGISAVISGKLDTGSFSTPAPLLFYSKGAEIRIVGGIMGQDGSVIVKPERTDIQSITDLRGKKVATVRLASSDAVLRAALKEAGIDWRKDLEIFELKNPPAVIESVKSGQVDAGVVWGPFDLRAEQQNLKVILRSGDLMPGHPCCRLIVTETLLQKNPQVVERFLRALLRAERFATDHRKETIDSIAKYVKLDRETLEKSFYSPNLDQTTDPNVKGVQQFWRSLIDSGFIEEKRPLDAIFVLGPYTKAIESLARENPQDAFYQARLAEFYERNNLASAKPAAKSTKAANPAKPAKPATGKAAGKGKS